MKDLLLRTGSGIVYISVIILSTMFFEMAYLVFPVLMLTAIWEFLKMHGATKKHFWYTSIVALLMFFGIHFLRSDSEMVDFYSGASLSVVLVLTVYLFSKSNLIKVRSKALFSLFYLAIPFSIIPIWFSQNTFYNSDNLLLLFVIIWVNDSFAYLFGVSFGRHKLMPSVSPKKSWEGLGGGVLMSVLAGYLVHQMGWVSGFELIDFEIFILITILAANLGDLVESRLKREVNVKDSGNVIPGHGGVLDRLDSFIFALPAVTFLMSIFN